MKKSDRSTGNFRMLLKTHCPSPEALRRYALGIFQDEEGDQLEQHLVDCSSCEDVLAEFESSSDSLLRHLPVAANTDDGASSSLPWLEKLKAGPKFWRADEDSAEGKSAETQLLSDGILGSYQLTGILGRGGMGVIYAAHHKQLGRDVAIKVVNPRLFSAAEAQARFDREIALLGKFDHPGIVGAIDAGRVSGAAYLVMEKVDGVDLARLLRRTGPLAIADACEVARQMADALAVAHQAGAVHRDIKPSNVMIDRSANVKLLDFGLASINALSTEIPSHETSCGKLIGTLDYMAPEQAEGKPSQVSADIFGLGATLFFLLTGRPPRQTNRDHGVLESLRIITEQPAPKLVSLRADVPQQLSELVDRLLSLHPENRPTNAADVSDALRPFQHENYSRTAISDLLDETCCEGQESDVQAVSVSLANLLIGEGRSQIGTTQSPLPLPPTHEPRKGQRRFSTRYLLPIMAAMALLGAGWWGVVLLLQTDNGTVRIESDLPFAEVEFVDRSQKVTGIEVETDASTVRLRAGQYRVRLKDESENALVQPVEIRVNRGETTVVNIQRQGAPLQTKMPGEEPVDRSIYQGQTRSTWQYRFDAETDPAAKIVAATALVQLYPEDKRQLVSDIVRLGGNLVNEGWGREGGAYCDWFINHMTKVTKHFRPRHWTGSDALADRWNTFVDQAENRLVQSLDSKQLATALCRHVAEGRNGEAAFAMHLLFKTRQHYQNDVGVANTLLATEVSSDLPRACWFSYVQMAYYPQAADDAQRAFTRSLTSTMHQAISQSSEDFHRSIAVGWLRAVQHYDVPIDGELQANVALIQLLNSPSETLSTVFQTRWLGDREFAYPDKWMIAAREATPNVWGDWMPVACGCLESNPDASSQSRDILTTLNVQLRLRSDSDNWPVSRLIEVLESRLDQNRNQQPEANESRHDLLAYIILAGGELPDISLHALQDATKTYPKEIQHLAETAEQNLNWNVQRAEFEARKGLLERWPVECVAMLLRGSKADSESKWSTSLFIEQLTWLSTRGDGDDAPPPMEPLLVLAIMTELSGQNKVIDDRIATLFSTSQYRNAFRRHIGDAVTYPFAIRTIAKKWLHRMRERSKSDTLNAQINQLIPSDDSRVSDTDSVHAEHDVEKSQPVIETRSMEEWTAHLTSEGTAKKRLAKATQAISNFHLYGDTKDEEGLIAQETIKVGAAAIPILWENMASAMHDFYLEDISKENFPKGLDNAGIDNDWFEFLGKAQSKIVSTCEHVTSTRILASAIQQG